MIFRCVKSNSSSDVLTIGRDEDQGGQDYCGQGTWQNFTFTELPVPGQDVKDAFAAHPQCILKVVGNSVQLKGVGELV